MTVAMSAMMSNNPTKKIMLKVTAPMMTTMTTVLHRDFEKDWSRFPFPLYKMHVSRVSFDLHAVAASSLIGLHPCVGLCSDAFLLE